MLRRSACSWRACLHHTHPCLHNGITACFRLEVGFARSEADELSARSGSCQEAKLAWHCICEIRTSLCESTDRQVAHADQRAMEHLSQRLSSFVLQPLGRQHRQHDFGRTSVDISLVMQRPCDTTAWSCVVAARMQPNLATRIARPRHVQVLFPSEAVCWCADPVQRCSGAALILIFPDTQCTPCFGIELC